MPNVLPKSNDHSGRPSESLHIPFSIPPSDFFSVSQPAPTLPTSFGLPGRLTCHDLGCGGSRCHRLYWAAGLWILGPAGARRPNEIESTWLDGVMKNDENLTPLTSKQERNIQQTLQDFKTPQTSTKSQEHLNRTLQKHPMNSYQPPATSPNHPIGSFGGASKVSWAMAGRDLQKLESIKGGLPEACRKRCWQMLENYFFGFVFGWFWVGCWMFQTCPFFGFETWTCFWQ